MTGGVSFQEFKNGDRVDSGRLGDGDEKSIDHIGCDVDSSYLEIRINDWIVKITTSEWATISATDCRAVSIDEA